MWNFLFFLSSFYFINKFTVSTASKMRHENHIKVKWNIQKVQSFTESMFTFSVSINKNGKKLMGWFGLIFNHFIEFFFVYLYNSTEFPIDQYQFAVFNRSRHWMYALYSEHIQHSNNGIHVTKMIELVNAS